MKYFLLLFVLISTQLKAQTGWQTVTGFGSNPGALNMYSYAPIALPTNAPLVLAMHGCTQTASQIAVQTGWNTLASRHGFYVVYPEQIAANNSNSCFNWFLSGDQSKNQGEALSIKQMVDYMCSHYSIDTNRIFVTGLSAGACMTNVMMACYPQTFNKGAVMAGVPYKAATSAGTASNATGGFVTQTPAQWGTLVRNENPSYTGPYPEVAVFHGSSDQVVNINNATEQVKQWTNVQGTDQTTDLTINTFAGNAYVTKNVYNNSTGQSVVETYIVTSFGHAIALDTGACFQQCGATGTYAYDINFNSTFWAAYFFDILQYPNSISGLNSVVSSQNGVVYSVTNTSGNTYNWIVPPGASIASGQGTNSITVNFGSSSGDVIVTETNAGACKIGPMSLFVNVGITSVSNIENNSAKIYYNAISRSIIINNSSQEKINSIKVFSIDGRLVLSNTNASEIFVSGLNSGIYIVETSLKNSVQRSRLYID